MWVSLYCHCSFVWSIKRFLWSYSDNPVSLLETTRKEIRKPKQVKWSCPNSTEFQWPYTWRCHAVNHTDFCFFSCQQLPGSLFWKTMGSMQIFRLCQCNHSFHSLSGFSQKHQSQNWTNLLHAFDSPVFLFTSAFNTVKIVIHCCGNKAVGIVIYVPLCLLYEEL